MKSSTAAMELIAAQTGDVFVCVGPDSVIRFMSGSARAYGHDPSALVGMAALDLVHPDDHAAFIANTTASFRGERLSPASRTHRYRTGDGRWVSMEGNPRIIRDRRGRPVEMVNVLRDVTERREAEARAEAEAAILRSAFEHGAVGKALITPDGRFQRINPALCDLLGYSEAEMLVLDFRDITHPDDLDADLERVRQLRDGQIPSYRLDKRYLRADGSIVWVELTVSLVRDERGDPKLYVVQVQDQTKRHNAEAALANSEAQFRLLAENAGDLVLVNRPDGVLSYLSPSALAMTGYRPEEAIGRSALHWIHPEDRDRVAEAFQEQVLSRGEAPPCVIAFRVVRKDGREIWVESSPRAHVDPASGQVTHVTDAGRDITQRKTAELLLAEAKVAAEAAAEAKALFLATMSHELRTPLTAVVGFARLTAELADLPDAARSYVDKLLVGAKALMATVNDILDFSKLEAGQVEIRPRAVAPRALLAESVGMFEGLASDRGLTLSQRWNGIPPAMLMLDDDRVRQVLLNLVGNAVKFTDTGGVEVEADYNADGRRFRCEVRDTGPGLNEDQQACLFQRFSQVDGSLARKHGGTGLGLAICKGIVEAMGGSIGVISAAGAGSTFWFEFPADPAAGALAAAGESDLVLADSRVLLVEDNATNRELARLILKPLGAEVTEAENGVEAVRLAGEQPFDLILMDLHMPELGGREAAEAIRADGGPNADIPILAFSADVIVEHGPFDGVVSKPIEIAALLRAVAEAINGPAAEGGGSDALAAG
ncbi:MAG TPA: PAS domain S-box protein [Caulobacter sp.]|nr:PAS domain S-box protein [Caulobacter sp.]